MIKFKNKPLSLKALHAIPTYFPKDSKSHARITPHGDLALTIKDGIRSMGWLIHKEEFSVTKNGEVVSGVFYVEMPKRLSIKNCIYCLGFTHGLGRRYRLSVYMGLWDREHEFGLVLDSIKGRKLCTNVELHQEALRILNLFKESTRKIKVPISKLHRDHVNEKSVVPLLWNIAKQEKAFGWIRMPLIINYIEQYPIISHYILYGACAKAIQISPDWHQFRKLHTLFKLIKKYAH